MGLYDRIDIFVGEFKLTARPVKFQLDENKNPIANLEYESTCPKCGALMLLSAADLIKDVRVVCITCKHGVNKISAVPEIVEAVKVQESIVATSKVRVEDCPFVDPIGNETFDVAWIGEK